MYIGCGRLSIIITEGQMRIFLMTPVGVVVTTRGRERVNDIIHDLIEIGQVGIPHHMCCTHNVVKDYF